MKLGTLYDVVRANVENKKQRKDFYWVIRELDTCRRDLGFNNNVDEVLSHIKDLFPYMISNMDYQEACLSQSVVNKLAHWLKKDIIITCTIVDEKSSSDSDDTASKDEAIVSDKETLESSDVSESGTQTVCNAWFQQQIDQIESLRKEVIIVTILNALVSLSTGIACGVMFSKSF